MLGKRAREKRREKLKKKLDREFEKENSEAADEEAEVVDEEQDGTFLPYQLHWDMNHANFYFDTAKAHFYGWYRKTEIRTGGLMHAIDIYVKHGKEEGKDLDLAVDSISYPNDPRTNMSSLNADIVAAANKWFYLKLNGSYKTIDVLRKQGEQPTIHIKRIATIDSIIMKLKECRDTAIRCGGTRLVQLHGDSDNKALNVVIDVRQQALALKGKIPTLELGSMMDVVLQTGNTGERSGSAFSRPLINKPSPENVQALVDRLKTTTDKTEQRKIRAVLRKMGHRGGGRSFKPAQTPSKESDKKSK